MIEEEILKQIGAGGRAQEMALKALYRGKASEFKRYFVHKGVRPDAAEDVLQDTIVKIFKNVIAFRGDGAGSDNSANAWMWTIARNCMNDHFAYVNRVHKPLTSYDKLPDLSKVEPDHKVLEREIDADHSADTQSVNECIAAGLEDFAAEQPDRFKVLMMQLDGEDIASIGNRIGRTMAATKEYLSQCRKKVAPYIAHCKALLPV
jgi:DNA-directed RNA polymerase specialized sigma24 family protein